MRMAEPFGVGNPFCRGYRLKSDIDLKIRGEQGTRTATKWKNGVVWWFI